MAKEVPHNAVADFMKHFNGHLLCAVDVETTGLHAGFHDIWQIAVVPLNADLQRNKNYKIFSTLIKPRNPQNYDVKSISRKKLAEVIVHALEADQVADLFQEWFNRLDLGLKRLIMPLAHNWPFDYSFIKDWLGHLRMEDIFHGHFRDTMSLALSMNDLSAFELTAYPYPKLTLGSMCARLNVVNHCPHDALSDAVATAEVYRRMVKSRMMLSGRLWQESIPNQKPEPPIEQSDLAQIHHEDSDTPLNTPYQGSDKHQ